MKIVIALLTLVFLFLAAVLVSDSKANQRYRSACEAEGGDYIYISRHGPVCLAKGTLIRP